MKEIFENINYGFISTGILNISSGKSKLAILFLPRDVTGFILNNILPNQRPLYYERVQHPKQKPMESPTFFHFSAVRAVRKVNLCEKIWLDGT